MAIFNKIIPGYVIQCFDTDTGEFFSQEFVQSSCDEVEYENAENGDTTDNSWTEFATDLPLDMVQPAGYNEAWDDGQGGAKTW